MNPTGNGLAKSRLPPPSASESPGTAPDDPRVVAALEEYASAVKAGRAPGRTAFLAQHPEIATVLAECLDGLEWMRGVAPAHPQTVTADFPSAGLVPAIPSIQPGTSLGDYQILREIGRGGMGVVFEAEQVSLRRRVALKVLPWAAALDPKQLQRFNNEAQAAAHLHHSNIVPVYAVGCEGAVHYFAMQFIEGQTLAALITDLRRRAHREPNSEDGTLSPASQSLGRLPSGGGPAAPAAGADPERTGPHGSEAARTPAGDIAVGLPGPGSVELSFPSPAFFRAVAHLGIQAALALEHAHQLGVIHRDIKPGNLLLETASPAPLGTDTGAGGLRLWITDFGLARCQHQAGLSMTGDLVGTLRYMSPEQALAQRGIIDHRTDVYSLSTTLYELLTLEPALTGHDRQELLRQIAFEEPRRPRRLNRAVPMELEAIVMKAMEKNPAERYATAGELAEDLQRFLDNRPVRARRPTLVHKVRKWSRRHQAVVLTATALTVAFLVLAVALLWLGYNRIRQERDAKDTALLEAEASARDARQAVDQYYTAVSESTLFDAPSLQPLRVRLLENALAYYKRLVQKHGDDPGLRAELAVAYFRVWRLSASMNRYDGGVAALRSGIEMAETLYRDHPQDAELLRRLAAYRKGALPYYGVYDYNNDPPPTQTFERAAKLWGSLGRRYPELAVFQLNLAETYFELARLAEGGAALPHPPLAYYQQAYEIWDGLARENPATLEYQAGRARVQSTRGSLLGAAGRFKDGEEAIVQALDFATTMAARFPHPARARYRELEGFASYHLVLVYRRAGLCEKAENAFSRAKACFLELDAAFPNAPLSRGRLMNLYGIVGQMYLEAGRLADAEKAAREQIALGEKLVAEFPDQSYDWRLAIGYRLLGQTLQAAGQTHEASRAFRREVPIREKGVVRFPTDQQSRTQLAACYLNLVQQLVAAGESRQAQDAARQARAFYEKLATLYPSGPQGHSYQADAQRTLTQLFRSANMPAEADEAMYRAVDIQRQLVAECPDNVSYRKELAHSHLDLALAYERQREPAKASAQWEQAALHLGRAIELQPKQLEPRLERAEFYALRDDWVKAAADLAAARDLNAGDVQLHYRHALARLGAADLPEYRRACAAMLERFDRTQSPEEAHWVCWALSLGPDAVQDWRQAVQLAEAAFQNNPNSDQYGNTLGAVLYRAGRFREAIERLEGIGKASKAKPPGISLAYPRFFLAMAHHRLGHVKESHQWLDRAVQRTQQEMAKPDAVPWNRSLTLRLLRREAEAMVGKRTG
jgi:serine/threonine protein kinase